MNGPRVLVADNDKSDFLYIKTLLEAEGYIVEIAETPEQVLGHVGQGDPPELVVLDIELGPAGGLQALEQCKQLRPRQKVLITASTAQAHQVVQAIKLGAEDFITKPFPPSRLRDAVFSAVGGGAEAADMPPQFPADHPDILESLDDENFFLAASPVMKQIRSQVTLVAKVDLPVLLLGESGSGKEVVARLIHKLSPRASGRLLKVNCAALPDELLESELFGYEAGAFTGAQRPKPGKFELANRGTMLLDEIGEMSPWLQAKLLHVLQDGSFSRLGGKNNISTNVRILAATNIDVEAAVAAKEFRQDLLYRLNTFTIQVPPLRERREEIPMLLTHFMSKQAADLQRPALKFSERLEQECVRYSWPGNVRELANLVKRYLVLEDETFIIEELHANDQAVAENCAVRSSERWNDLKTRVSLQRDQAEAREIQRALENANWNRRSAAAQLKISYRTLLSKMKRHKLTAPAETGRGWLRYG